MTITIVICPKVKIEHRSKQIAATADNARYLKRRALVQQIMDETKQTIELCYTEIKGINEYVGNE